MDAVKEHLMKDNYRELTTFMEVHALLVLYH